MNYIEDSSAKQPWNDIWNYTNSDEERDTDDGSYSDLSTLRESPQVDLTPTDAENELITNLKNAITQVDQENPKQDDILIGYITDTHFSSYKTPGTVRALHQMKLMSYIAHEVGLDLVVNGGDLNDGAAPSNWEMDDIKRAVDATMLGRRPFIILQGNHDDDSGFARDDNHDENGYWPDNICLLYTSPSPRDA